MNFEKINHHVVSNYERKTPKSAAAYQKARQYLGGGETRSVSYYFPYPLTIAYGSGCEIHDLDGNTYIDLINNYTSLIHGHAHPLITEAIARAVEKGTAVPAGIEEQVQLAEFLCTRVPSLERVRFCNSGTEATLFAVRAAMAYTGKFGLLKILGGYHGTTDRMEYNVAPELDYAQPENMYKPAPDIPGVTPSLKNDMFIMPFNDLNAAEKVMKENASDIAALIVEPFLGAGGLIPTEPGYLEGLRSLCDRYRILLIFDEVQSLRLSEGGAQNRYGVMPDLSAFGKIIGGGLAVGGFGGRKDIMELFDCSKTQHLTQSGTFNGNRPTMAAGYTALSLFDQAACDRLERMAEKLQMSIENAFHELRIDGCVTRAGSLMNYHFTAEKPRDYLAACKDNKDYLRLMHLEMLDHGVFLAPRGTIALSTPMNDTVIEHIGKAFYQSLHHIIEMSEV